MTMSAQLLTSTEIQSPTPSARTKKQEPVPTNVFLTPSELDWVRTLPRGRRVLKDALLQPVPVTEWLESVETAIMISRVSSSYLASRSARRRAEGPALELLRSTCIDICLERLPRDVAVTSAHVDQVETLVRTYIHAQGAPRANLPTTERWSIRLRPEVAAALSATAASLGMSRALLIRCLIGAHVEGAKGLFPSSPSDPLTTPMATRHETLLGMRAGMRAGLLAMQAAQAAESTETTPQQLVA